MQTEQQWPPAGWYPHPSMSGTQRYWNGVSWTDYVAPAAIRQVVMPSAVPDWMLGVGYAGALMLPVVGFVIGVIVASKGKPGHGVAMMVLSVVVVGIVLGSYS
jgi:hypothetical protein